MLLDDPAPKFPFPPLLLPLGRLVADIGLVFGFKLVELPLLLFGAPG
jgi:hypothetical protein